MAGSADTPRRLACEILDRVERGGAFASILVDAAAARLRDPRDLALLREIVMGVLRRRSALDAAIAAAAERPIERIDEALHAPLRVGAYQLLCLRVPDHAAVDATVALVERPSPRGFVNAVLRRVAREGGALLPAKPPEGDVAALARWGSHPEWWTRRLVERVGWARAEAVLAADNEPAAPVLVPNPRVIDSEGLAALAEARGLSTEPGRWVPTARVVTSGNLARSGLLEGPEAWVQDEAAQLVPRLLGEPLGPRIADLCAAPGGKTACLAVAAPPEAQIVAVDRHRGRVGRLERQLRRLGLEQRVEVLVHDLSAAPVDREPFDQVLVDAPCSGSGTFRRHPEIRWRLTPERIDALVETQRRILEHAIAMLAPGGLLVYAVCSIEPEEGQQQVEALLERVPALRPEPCGDAVPTALGSDDGRLATDPADGLDGFFAARLRYRQ